MEDRTMTSRDTFKWGRTVYRVKKDNTDTAYSPTFTLTGPRGGITGLYLCKGKSNLYRARNPRNLSASTPFNDHRFTVQNGQIRIMNWMEAIEERIA
jgi:hypothetical protein